MQILPDDVNERGNSGRHTVSVGCVLVCFNVLFKNEVQGQVLFELSELTVELQVAKDLLDPPILVDLPKLRKLSFQQQSADQNQIQICEKRVARQTTLSLDPQTWQRSQQRREGGCPIERFCHSRALAE